MNLCLERLGLEEVLVHPDPVQGRERRGEEVVIQDLE
jgi:hypothetical protein